MESPRIKFFTGRCAFRDDAVSLPNYIEVDVALSSGGGPPQGNISYDALYQAIAPFLTRVLRYLRVPERDAQDVAQDVRLTIFRQAILDLSPDHPLHRWVRGDPEGERYLQRWVGSIAYHIVLNYRMAAFRHREQFTSTGVVRAVSKEPSPAQQFAHAERLCDLFELLNGLDESRRTILLMHYFESQTTEAIARQLGIPEGTVSSRLRLARADLKTAIERTARGELRTLLEADDWDPAFEQPSAIAADPGDGSTATDQSADDRRWAGLLAALLIVGLRRIPVPLGTPPATRESCTASDGSVDKPWRRERKVHPSALTAPLSVLSILFATTCNSQADVARVLPRVAVSFVTSSLAPAPTIPRESAVLLAPPWTTQEDVPPEGLRERPAEPVVLPADSNGSMSLWGLPHDSATPVVERPIEMRPTPAMIPTLFALCLSASGCDQKPPDDVDSSGGTGTNGAGGAAGTGGSGGTGGSEVCDPGAVKPCYSGPPGTEGVSHCKGGTATCRTDGAGWGACIGESAPVTEICSAPEDEDCDGDAPACAGNLMWAKTWGGGQTDSVNGVAVDADGNTWLTGNFTFMIDFGGGPLNSNSPNKDMYLAKVDPDGNHLWSRHFGGPTDNDNGKSIALDAAGNVVVTGNFGINIDFGGGPIPSPLWASLFLTSFDATGAHRWSRGFPGDPCTVMTVTLAVEPAGSTILALSAIGNIDVGDGPMSSGNDEVLYLAKYDPAGGHLWTKRFASPTGLVRATSVAVNGDGTIVLGGQLSGTASFGGFPLAAAGLDGFVAQFDSSGNHLWSRRFGDPLQQLVGGVAMDPANHVIVTGQFYGTIDLGGGPLVSAGDTDLFLVELDASGNHLWSKRFGDANAQQVVDDHALSVDHAGDILWTGTFYGTVDFGGNPLTAPNPYMESFVTKLDSSGNHLWSRQIATAGARSITHDPSGNIVASGMFYSPIDVGSGPLTSSGDNDIYLVKLTP